MQQFTSTPALNGRFAGYAQAQRDGLWQHHKNYQDLYKLQGFVSSK